MTALQHQTHHPVYAAHDSIDVLATQMPTGYRVESLSPQPRLWHVRGRMQALLLASIIFDARRRRPLVLLTPTAGSFDHLDIDEIAVRTWDIADVALIEDAETTAAVCSALPPHMHVYEGGTRIFRPGAELGECAERHLLVPPERTGTAQAATYRVVGYTQQVAQQEQRITPLRSIGDKPRSSGTRPQQNRAARIDSDDMELAKVFTDPAQQFDHDLYNLWLGKVIQPERELWALRGYQLGPEFLDSVAEQQLVNYKRVVLAAVDVVTGRYKEINGRRAKRVPDGHPSAPSLVRAADGATAWRMSVQNKANQAARMMWWEMGDCIELSRVAGHDDFRVA